MTLDTAHGLIAHLDLAAVINGAAPTWTLIHVDLAAGAEAADLVRQAQAYAKRRDIFTPITTTTTEDATDEDHDLVEAGQEPGLEQGVGTHADDDGSGTGHSGASGDEPGEPLPMGDVAPADRGEQLRAVPDRIPDEGLTLGEDAFAPLKAKQATLTDAQRTFVKGVVEESQRATAADPNDPDNDLARRSVSIHTSAGLTERRHAAIRAVLAASANVDDDPAEAVDMLRAAIAYVVAADWPLFANVEPGHALGLLHADQAVAVAELLKRLTDGGATSAEWAAIGRLVAATPAAA